MNYGIQEEDCGLKLKVFGEAVVMRAWHAFLSSVNFTFIVNFFLAFSFSLIYLLSFCFSFSFFSFYLFTNSLFVLALVPTYLLCLNII